MWRFLVGFHHVRDPGEVDDILSVHVHHQVIGVALVERSCLEAVVRHGDTLASECQRFDDFRNQPWQFPFDLGGMPSLDDVLAREGKVVACKDTGTEADTDGEGFVVRISQTNHIRVVPIGRAQGNDTKELVAVGCDAVVLLDHFMAEERERVLHIVHHRVMGDGEVCGGRCRGCEFTQASIVHRHRARV